MPRARRDVYSRRWTVRSFTDWDTEYTVSKKRADGSMACSCKAWIFQRQRLPNGHCKHIERVLLDIEREKQAQRIERAEARRIEKAEAEAQQLIAQWSVEEIAMPELSMERIEERSW